MAGGTTSEVLRPANPDAIPSRDIYEVGTCPDCWRRRRIYFPPYCDRCWYNHAGESCRTIRYAVRRHVFGDTIMTCGHRHMSWLNAVRCCFTLMDPSVRDDPKAIEYWISKIVLVPME